MNYAEIQAAAYGFADRKDAATLGMYDTFLVISESKVNRHLKDLKSTARVSLPSVPNQTYYGLPPDFNGMRNMQISGPNPTGGTQTITAKFLSPAQINEKRNIPDTSYIQDVYFTIINEQIQIEPQLEKQTIEMVYYRKVQPLTAIADTNWLSDTYPDCYIYGVLFQISSFNKDAETAAQWSGLFAEALLEIIENDADIRWGSGDMLQVRVD